MKVYVHYEEGSDPELHVTLKLTLPKKWDQESPVKVLQLFLDNYNKKKLENQLDPAAYHLETLDGKAFCRNDVIGEIMTDRGDVYVRAGETLEGKPQAPTKPGPHPQVQTGLKCRNFGCNKVFSEAENSDTACHHHTAPPIFHDTRKGWGCCEKRVYDWDEFQQIQGCSTGPHSTKDPKDTFAASPTVALAQQAINNQPPVQIKSIADFNLANPDAATAASSAVKSLTQPPSKHTRNADGTARCINKGCQKLFVTAENRAEACRYHELNPVFHDTGKFWACCPGKVKYEFDDFMAIEGCQTGYHNDGSGEFY